jgi:hypothetical protein
MGGIKNIKFESNTYHYSDPIFKIFRIHPHGARIEKAEKTLKGQANKDALTWCGPYSSANSYGWWLYPGFDVDIICHREPVEGGFTGRWGGNFSYHIVGYDNSDFEYMENFQNNIENKFPFKYAGLTHYAIDEPEINCISLWTGCVFQMPKDWSIMIKSPTNCGLIYEKSSPACIQEGILEFDWLRYDIWTNFKFHEYEKPLRLRKNQDWPIAQLIPIHRSSYETQWVTEEIFMDSENSDCVNMFERYSEYNYKKWSLQGEKDPFTYRKLRKSEQNQCPIKDIF